MSTDRYDVLIIRAETRQVIDVVGFALPLEAQGLRQSAASVTVDLLPHIRDGLEVAIVKARKYAEGDTLPEEVETQRRTRKRVYAGPDTYSPIQRERMADSKCVRCGAPDVNGILCPACEEKNRRNTEYSPEKRRARYAAEKAKSEV